MFKQRAYTFTRLESVCRGPAQEPCFLPDNGGLFLVNLADFLYLICSLGQLCTLIFNVIIGLY